MAGKVHKRLYSFKITHSLMENTEFGFRKYYSDIALDSGNESLSGFLDHSKAFNTTLHSLICIHRHGIRGVVLEFFRKHISETKQYVSYKVTV